MTTSTTTTNTASASVKYTQRDYFNAIRAILAGEFAPDGMTYEMIDAFIEGRIAQLDKRSASAKPSGEKKPTARQKENAALKQAILSNMEDGSEYTISDMVKNFDCFAEGISSQRVNAIVSQMVADVKHGSELTKTGEQPSIVRTEVKGVAYFARIAE